MTPPPWCGAAEDTRRWAWRPSIPQLPPGSPSP
nr:MAG TPA: hypothetical protein [Caudoviricetes sp.]